ncbi:GNAT family N-acetyltransferase [Cohnella nanjingensis]|uniref:GNAT family N-acetyltransferase n=1 Tax=Cohnella nanjingensis TaxID=1387779 RepID=A0A7X0VCW7_9BACL|nr:GNAT family N-acetyltransferase [Cohnella nanjingensis]MBB6669367.1 GNAT family N-acetyltransferase [Cohnella nanjingensis]
MEIKIESADREDFLEMIELADLTMPDRMNLHELKKYFELFPDLIFKATHNNRLVGFSCAGIDMYQTTGWLLFSNVIEEYRGRGIGKKLIQVRLQVLQQFQALEQVLVTVNASNTASICALQSAGFEMNRMENDYYGPGKHRNIMRLAVATSASRNITEPPVITAVGFHYFRIIRKDRP